MTRRGLRASLLVALVMVGCDAVRMQVTGELPFFPVEPDGPRPMLLARSSGTLVLVDQCLWLESGSERHLMVWPAGHRVEWRDGQLAVVNVVGNVEGRVGAEIVVGGGEWRSSDGRLAIDPQVEALIGRAIPPACRRGLYWMGGILSTGP